MPWTTYLQAALPLLLVLPPLFYLAWRAFSGESDDSLIEIPEGLNLCDYCGGYHNFMCPYVESIEWDGALRKRVVFRREHLKALEPQILWGTPPVVEDEVSAAP